MKKYLAMLLAVLMLASLGLTAFAQDYEWYDLDYPSAGITLMVPDSMLFYNQGVVDVLAADEVGYKSGVYVLYLAYIGVSEDDYYNGDYEDDSYAPLLTIVGLKENYDSNAFAQANNTLHMDLNQASNLGMVDGVTFYATIGTDVLPAGIQSPYAEEYENLLQYVPDVINNSSFYGPVAPFSEQAGTSAAFQTIDLDGNTVNSADLFAQNEITLVNLWATWCPHCIEELPDLAQIHQQLQGIGCGIVGLLSDESDPETLADAREILEDAGVTYPCIVMPAGGSDLFPTSGLPCSYFVNRNGEIVGAPIEGKQVTKYYEAVQDLLNGGVESDIVTDAPGAAPIVPVYDAPSIPGFGTTMGAANLGGVKAGVPVASGTEYRVICVDEAGNPVAGAAVQFCSDITCMMAKTDENGVAVFDVDPGHYTVHLLKPPAGYAKDSTEYETPATFGDVTIVVKAG